jgi:ATP-dependent RNA helicase DDX31/DBP7
MGGGYFNKASKKKLQAKKRAAQAKIDAAKPKAAVSTTGGQSRSRDETKGDQRSTPNSAVLRSSLFTREKDFSGVDLHPALVKALEKEWNITQPTAIQQSALKHVLGDASRDCLIKSITGSGKTLCFLLPICDRLIRNSATRAQGTLAVVLSPTRELVMQIQEVADKLLKAFPHIVAGSVMGGEKRKSEKARLRKGVNILVATPGRILDHLEKTQSFDVSAVEFIALDEADRLLDMGFEKDVKAIIATLKTRASRAAADKRQVMLVSATLSVQIEHLASFVLKNPVLVGFRNQHTNSELLAHNVAGGMDVEEAGEEKHALPKQLQHKYVMIRSSGNRLLALMALLKHKLAEGAQKGIVFFSTCDSVDFHHKLMEDLRWSNNATLGSSESSSSSSSSSGRARLQDNVSDSEDSDDSDGGRVDRKRSRTQAPDNRPKMFDVPVLKLHGSMVQKNRTQTWQQFRKTDSALLICTDVAARGLDLPAVDFIVQYDAPELVTDYVHRTGRTARIGRKGTGILFLSESESQYLDVLKAEEIEASQLELRVMLKCLDGTTEQKTLRDDGGSSSGPGFRLKEVIRRTIAKDLKLTEMATNAFGSYIRAYATYPKHLKHIFHPNRLHLGHVASGFGLKEAPKVLGKRNMKMAGKKRKHREHDIEDGVAGIDRHEGEDVNPDFAANKRKMFTVANKQIGKMTDEFAA